MLENDNELEALKAVSATERVKEAIINFLYTMLFRYDYLLRQQEGSGGYQRAAINFNSSVRTLYELLRPRITRKAAQGYGFNYEELDHLATSDTPLLMRRLLEYLELDLGLTRIDYKKDFNRKTIKGF